MPYKQTIHKAKVNPYPLSSKDFSNYKFTFYSDSRHGWVAVPTTLLKSLKIDNQISSYSYMSPSGKTVYLEEDNDATLFSKAYKERYGKEFDYEESNTAEGNSPIRSYLHYKNYSSEEKLEMEEFRNKMLNDSSKNWSVKAIRKIKRASKRDLDYWKEKGY